MIAIARKGFTIKALGTMAVVMTVVMAENVSGRITDDGPIAYIVAGTGPIAIAGAVATTRGEIVARADAVAVAVVVTSASILLSLYINYRIRCYNSKFENLRIIGLAFSTLFATSFSGADLADAYFTKAILKSISFANSRKQSTTFTHVRWHHAQKLDRARLENSNLQDLRVRETPITLDGNNKNLAKTNFEGTNLTDAQLRGTNLKGANLNRTNLEGAQLHQANLTEASCMGSNFTAAQSTEACLEGLND